MKRIAFFIPHAGCPHTCIFCNQHTISGQMGFPKPQDIENQLESSLKVLGKDANTTQVAFFGGSFTALPKEVFLPLLDVAKTFVDRYGLDGIRFSTRPDSVNDTLLAELKDYPIRQVELGVQSMNSHVLSLNQRGHSTADVRNAAAAVRRAGLGLTLQMMVGMYGDLPEGPMETAMQISDLEPEEVRIYPTLVLHDTILHDLLQRGNYVPLDLDVTIEICADLLTFFEEKQIKVIRLGLHEEDGLGGQIVAGPYHPALRELCEGRCLRRKILGQMNAKNIKQATVIVSSRDISKIKGHGGLVEKQLQQLGYELLFKTSSQVKSGNIVLVE